MNQLEGAAPATCISGGGCSGGGRYSLDGMDSAPLSLLLQDQPEQGRVAPLRQGMASHIPALLHRPGTGIKQAREGTMWKLPVEDVGPQRSAPPYNRPTGAAQFESQQAVQEALEAAISTVGSAGDGRVVEILSRMQAQLVARRQRT